ncbi:MAG: peptidylprolyl isomerase [Cyclobacteriaceae bacterium]|nr:peptidylprolyl isomerase [Cyclobacteriaceae bacterium]
MHFILRIFLFTAGIAILGACAEKDYVITLSTEMGDMKVVLYDETPLHKENFIKLAKSGKYDGTIFHRVIQNFMVQGGDVNAVPGRESSIEYTIPAEFNPSLFHHKGALAAARMGDNVNPEKASSGCQFYIVQGTVMSREQLTLDMAKVNQRLNDLLINYEEYAPYRDTITMAYHSGDNANYMASIIKMVPILEEVYNEKFVREMPEDRLEKYTSIGGAPHLDDAYTVFGKVIEGFDVIDKIAAIETGMADKPVEDIQMKVKLQTISKKEWLSKYGSSN